MSPPQKPERVAVVGSRTYKNLAQVTAYVESLPLSTVIISGGAKGVDKTAENEARRRGMNLKVYLPDYNAYPGNLAPLFRNQDIVDNSDRVVAFWDGESSGTRHTITLARNKGIPVLVFLDNPVKVP